MRHVSGGAQARDLSRSYEEAAAGGGGEGVVPGKAPRAALGEVEGNASGASRRDCVPTGGANGGDAGDERVREGV